MWLAIIFIAAHDSLLVLLNRQSMLYFERNPLGLWLIRASGGDIWLLLAVKTLGTLAASSILLLLYWARPRHGFFACAAIAAFQLGLLIYLYAT